MRRLLALAILLSLRASPAEACSHPPGTASLGPPQLVRPADGATSVALDAEITLSWVDCCYDEQDGPPLVDRAWIRDSTGSVVPVVSTVSEGWGDLGYFLWARTARLRPTAALPPNATYEVFAQMPSNWGSVVMSIGTFTTGDAPFAGSAPGAPMLTVSAAPTVACGEVPELACCLGGDRRFVSMVTFQGTEPDLLYAVTDADGSLLATDARAPISGIIDCGGSDQWFEGTMNPPWIPWRRHASQVPTMLTITARDAIGRESPSVQVPLEVSCTVPTAPDAGPTSPDGGAAIDDSDGGCGCRAGRRGSGPIATFVPLCAMWLLRKRRRSA